MAVSAPIPVYLRVGDGQECRVGTFTPDISGPQVPADGRIGLVTMEIGWREPLAALLREVAGEISPEPAAPVTS